MTAAAALVPLHTGCRTGPGLQAPWHTKPLKERVHPRTGFTITIEPPPVRRGTLQAGRRSDSLVFLRALLEIYSQRSERTLVAYAYMTLAALVAFAVFNTLRKPLKRAFWAE